MGDLIYSKRFKKNLLKWLITYISVLLLLSVVVTYSKYISSFDGSSSAKVAKFKIDIKSLGTCVNVSGVCTTFDTYRPTSEINYLFSIDPTGLEVTTFLDIKLTVQEGFNIVGLLDANNNSQDYEEIANGIEIKRKIGIDETVKEYKLILKYNGNLIKNNIFNDSGSSLGAKNEIVKIDYSATQVD